MPKHVDSLTPRRRATVLWLCSLAVMCSACHRKKSPVASETKPGISEVFLTEPAHQSRILRGVSRGSTDWSWTGPSFAVSLDAPPRDKPVWLELDFSVPNELGPQVPVTVIARINGVEVGRRRYGKPDRYLFAQRVPSEALTRSPAEVEFHVDRSIKDQDGRVLGLIVVSVALKEYEATAEYRDIQMRLSREGYQKLLEERKVRMPAQKQTELMRLFHDLPVWQNLWFQNVRIIKNPLDLWMMQQIIYEVRPDFIIETGTWLGGSALYWAYTLHGMGLENSRVLTVDVQDLTRQGASANILWKKYVEFFHGSSTDAALVSRIAERVKGRKTLVTLDSDHARRHVLNELRLYSPMITSGSYIVVEDTHYDSVPIYPQFGPGPMAAVRQFLEEGGSKDFEQDPTREALVMTFNPGGWLRRK